MNHNIVPNLSLSVLLAILQTYLSPHWGGAEGAGGETADIETANLPPATERLAHRLLARCHPDNGHVTLTWDEFLSIAGGLRNRGAAGKHLTRLKQANLIHYSTNPSHVYITFRAWLDREEGEFTAEGAVDAEKREENLSDPCALRVEVGDVEPDEPARDRGQSEAEQKKEGRFTAEDAVGAEKRNEDLSAPCALGVEVSGVEPDDPARARAQLADAAPLTPPNVCLSFKDPNDPETDKHVERANASINAEGAVGAEKREEDLSVPGALCVESSERQIDEEQQKRNYALLTDPDVGISGQVAEQLAAQHEFEWLLKQVFAWRRDQQQGKVNGTGALIHRLRCGWSAAPLSREEKRSDLYARHCGVYDPWVGCEGQGQSEVELLAKARLLDPRQGQVEQTDNFQEASTHHMERPTTTGHLQEDLPNPDIDLVRQTVNEVTRNHPLCRDLAIELQADTLIIRGVQQALTLLERAATMIGRRLRAAWGRPVQVVVEPIGA